ncbi:PepSY domain-containing protein [Kocuria rhizophila]|uniref:PepSY-associated TM helix domain-containing protein n=1 Tax=Kocuria TaxID=57493 RepID=UPI0002D9793F|nr:MULTISPECIES: PepSY domain-containing protein [Kocuria]MCT1958734.1 PepSY domain-containing protein [Kocuria rhizophila]MCT2074661.1 PepSY domain-containing protein [Kocuria rhizophila]MCT2250469.1 PepSY domain-containing protein [Kocuria rhizophila]MDA4829450.1 PepSY domain-containing protein [Kocuria rhizophila]MDN3226512.1 PepSY domain-containing protein [Kocuria rhizophila]
MSTALDASSSERARTGAPIMSVWLLPLLRRLHFYAGLLVGPFLVVAAVTGALYVFTPQLERVVYADALTGTASAQPLSLDEQVDAARRSIGSPDSPVNVRPASDGGTTRVMFADPALERGESRAVFVDPGTGRVTGDMTVYGTSGALPLRTTIDRLHRDLLLGEPGRLYSELAASWLWVLALSGLCMVVLHRRRVARGRRARVTLVPRPAEANAYRRTRSWHTATGVWLAVGFLFLAASGLTWSAHAGENVAQLRTALNWTTPKVSTDLGGASGGGAEDEHAGHHGHDGHQGHQGPDDAGVQGSFDAVLATAREAGLDSRIVELKPAAADGAAWTVSENERSWPTQVDSVAVDPQRLHVTDQVRFSEWGLPAKLTQWAIAAHMGLLFGLPNQLVLLALAAAIVVLVVSGYSMWWRRRPTRAAGVQFGPLPPRGALRATPVWAWLALGLGTVAVGLFVPLLGLSLLGFLAVDLLLGLRARRRSDGTAARVASQERGRGGIAGADAGEDRAPLPAPSLEGMDRG